MALNFLGGDVSVHFCDARRGSVKSSGRSTVRRLREAHFFRGAQTVGGVAFPGNPGQAGVEVPAAISHSKLPSLFFQ